MPQGRKPTFWRCSAANGLDSAPPKKVRPAAPLTIDSTPRRLYHFSHEIRPFPRACPFSRYRPFPRVQETRWFCPRRRATDPQRTKRSREKSGAAARSEGGGFDLDQFVQAGVGLSKRPFL